MNNIYQFEIWKRLPLARGGTSHFKSKPNSFWFIPKAILLSFFFSFIFIAQSFASHYRYSNVSWRATGNLNEIEFTIETGWRTTFNSFGYATAADVSIGDMVDVGSFNFGDGSPTEDNIVEVTSFDVAEDWFFGVAKLTHTYASAGDYIAFLDSCCRIAGLQNNATQGYRNQVIVNVGGNNNPPIATLTPIVAFAVDQAPETFQFLALDVDGDNLRYRLATPAEAGDGSFVQPTGLSIDANTGLISWNTMGLTIDDLYNAVIVVEDLDGTGAVKSNVQVDFLIKIATQTDPPQFISPTPADGMTFNLHTDVPFNFSVTANDPDGAGNPGGDVILNAVGQPIGASFTPMIPTTAANPVSSMFSWTPILADIGTYQIVLVASDDLGAQTLTRVNLNVFAKPNLVVSNDTILCAPAEFCPNATVTDAFGNGIPNLGIVFDVRGANSSRFPTTGSGATSGSGSCRHCFDFVNPGKDSIIIFVDTPGGQISDTICVTTFDANDKPVAKVKKEYCVYLDAHGQGTITPDSLDDGSQAPCGLQGLTIDKSTFTCADIAASPVLVRFTVTGTNGKTASAFTEVTVKDTFPPVITCVDTIKGFLDGYGLLTVDSAYLVSQGFSFNDNDVNSCGVDGVLLNGLKKLDYDCSVLADFINIMVTAIDGSGNQTTCETVIEIIDKESPELDCPLPTLIEIELNPDGLDTFIISESGLFGATDNCGKPFFEADSLFFSCADIGTWSKKIVLADSSGNKASCYRNFKVADVTPPTIICKYPIGGPDTLRLYLDIYGNATLVPSSLDNGTKDSCTDVTFTAAQTAFSCLDITPAGTRVFVNLYATDAYGNTDSCQNIVQVLDTIAPLVFCKDSIMVLLDSNGVASVPKIEFFGLIKDECGIRDTTVSRTDFSCYDVGKEVFVDVTVTDNGGRATTCQVKVIVKDEIAPVLVCQDKITLELGTDGKLTIANDALLAAPPFDNCEVDSLYVSQSEFFCSNIGTYTVITTAVDKSGNKSTCSTEVTIVDNMSPTTVCNSITVLVGDGGQVTINPSQVDGGSTDNCGIINMSVHPKTFDCSDVGKTIEVVLTTADASGNSSSCKAWVTVSESSLPIAVCKSDVIVQLDEFGQGSIEVADVDDGSSIACNSPSIELRGRTDFDCSDIKNNSIYVTLIVTDASGNQDSCKSKIIVQDNIAPKAVCAGGTFNLPLGLNGTAILPVNFMDAGSSDACGIETRIVKPNNFTCDDLGPNNIALIVIDSSGNADTCYRVINVVNSSAPNLVCKDITVYLDADGKVNILPGDVVDKTASDCFGNIALALTDSSFTCADKGTNSVTLSLASGTYTNSCTAIVTVLDTLVPIITCKNDITVAIDAWGVAMVTLADVLEAVSDNCDIKDTIWTDVNFSCLDVATSPKEVSVTVTDSSGNSMTCITKVTVVDNSMPIVMDCPTDTVLSPQIQCKAAYKFGYPTFSDDCGIVDTTVTSSDTNVNLVMEGDSISGVFKLTTTITFTVTDASGNQASCDFKIAVEDTHKPTFGNTCPAYPVQYVQPGECGINFVATNLAPQDNCGIDTYICTFRLPNGDIFTTPPSTAPVFLPIGTTTVSHVITDFAGNESECSYTITVEDNEAPTIDFNNNHPDFPLGLYTDGDTIDIPAGIVPVYTASEVDVADNCEIDEITFQDFLIENNVCASKGYDRLYRCVWTATDKSGNTTQSVVYLRIACPVINTPDLQPNFTFAATSFKKGDVKMVIININEIDNGPTAGAIKFFLPKSSGFTYAFDQAQTSANVLYPQSVNNPDWTVQVLPTGLLFTSNIMIPAGGRSRIGIRVTADTNGAKASMTANVQASAGGEIRSDNNVAVLSQSVQN